MKLIVRYFASIREDAGINTEVVELRRCALTIDSLRAELSAQSARRRMALSPDRVIRTAVDRELQPGCFPLHDGCEVAFFPPVTGG